MNSFSQQDKQQIEARGMTVEQVEHQLKQISHGFPFLKLEAPAAVDEGIKALSDKEKDRYMKIQADYAAEGHRIVKFVPASGAASRMFKNLFAFLSADYDVPTTAFEKEFFDNIKRFAFRKALCDKCKADAAMGLCKMIETGRYKDVVRNLLSKEGLNYGQLPKGLLLFHEYEDGPVTPMEEHLREAALYAASNGEAHVHFTVSHDHLEFFKQRVDEVKDKYEARYGVKYDITFSEQKPSTDTIAAEAGGKGDVPFRNADGSLLFRPGGHGALIENLNDIDADIVFIKNIDNVVVERKVQPTVEYKKLLAGVLISMQRQAFEYLEILDRGDYELDDLMEMSAFVELQLGVSNPDVFLLDTQELAQYLRKKLNRPMRVCGVVRNVGEPGGGPFLAYNHDGTISPQILESSQIDMNNADYKRMFTEGTHFNPVDIVCALKNYKGEAFDLTKYVDPRTGFISQKSKDGRELLALELPGLWNGAMSDWSTIFVEVPLETFNPVKTVNDLLRDAHQGTMNE